MVTSNVGQTWIFSLKPHDENGCSTRYERVVRDERIVPRRKYFGNSLLWM